MARRFEISISPSAEKKGDLTAVINPSVVKREGETSLDTPLTAVVGPPVEVDTVTPLSAIWDVPDEAVTVDDSPIVVGVEFPFDVLRAGGLDMEVDPENWIRFQGVEIDLDTLVVEAIDDDDADEFDLRISELPTGRLENDAEFEFIVRTTFNQNLASAPTASSLSLAPARITGVCQIVCLQSYRFTARTPDMGGGQIIITANSSAFSVLSADRELGRVLYGEVQDAPTVQLSTGTLSGNIFTFRATWSADVGSGTFTPSDVTVTSSEARVGVNVDAVTPVTSGVFTAFNITTRLTPNPVLTPGETVTGTLTATIRDDAIPESPSHRATVEATGSVGTFTLAEPRITGFTPSLGRALTSTGTALPSNADGDANQPIVRRTQFIVPVTWSSQAASEAVSQFRSNDVSASLSVTGASGSASVGTATRQGSTNVWHVPITVSRTGSAGGLGTVGVSIRQGALPQTATTEASQAASRNYAYRLQGAAPTATIGTGTRTGSTVSFPVDWSVNVGTAFTAADVSITSSNSGQTISNINVSHRPGGTQGEDFTVTATLSRGGTTTLTAVIRAGAIPVSDEYVASARTTQNLGQFAYLFDGATPLFDTPLSSSGTALPANADGDIPNRSQWRNWQSINDQVTILIPITWCESDVQTQAATEFTSADVSVTYRDAALPDVLRSNKVSFTVGTPVRVGSTAVWRVPITARNVARERARGLIRVVVRTGAIPASTTRAASQSDYREYAYRLDFNVGI